MLTLHLTLDNGQVTVSANELQSHSFSIRYLDNKDLKYFVNDPKPYGAKLFQALFKDGSEARKVFDDLSKQTERTIVIVLESSELDGIAWEYAYHDNAYIVEDFAFIHALPEKERPHANGRLNKSVERVPLLFIPANPLVDLSGEPMHELDIESEWHEMTQHIAKSNAPFDLIELRPATPAALQSVMARFQNGIIAHFSGHGAATKDGAFLLFENENGSSNPLEAREFVREVKDQAWIGFLSACQSAVAERTEFGNLARELVKAGVPFALGMQFNLPDPFAPNISGQFYNYLSQGHAVPEAARQARRAVKRENEFYVGMIALYAAHPDEAGKMGWSGSGARTLPTFTTANVSDLPTPSGFIGRQRELMNIGTSLLGKKKPNTVTLHGAGGIGKTALMRQTLVRFAPSFEAALAIALDPLLSLESVLGRLERFLNLPSPCANATKEREQIVHERLASKRTLLGLDNFETLIHARDNGSDEEKKTAKSLYSFFKSLAAEGVILCVTSREKTSLPGEMIQEIHGLEDEVGGRLFQNTVSTRRDALNEAGLEKISAAVGGHPLALRLLAPIFEEQAGLTLDGFIQKLEIFLPKAYDEWTEQERHESLEACFAFSMDNLPKNEEGENLQTGLARLSMFIAFFLSLTAAPVLENEQPESENKYQMIHDKAENTLHVLWEHGLLERVIIGFQDKNYFMYRLHPALGLFARERLTDIKGAKENYRKSMNVFVRIAAYQIEKSPLMAQIALRAIPDLLNVAEFKDNEDAVLIRLNVSKILQQFGLYDDSLYMLEKSLEINETDNNLQGKSAILHSMAHVYVVRSDLERAINLYQQALEIDGGLGDLESKAATLHSMAHIHYVRGDLDEAMKLYQQALEIENGSDSLLEGKAATLAWIGSIDEAKGDLDNALSLYQESFEIGKKTGNLKVQSSTSRQMAGIYVMRDDLDRAMKLCQQSLEIEDGLGNQQGKSATLHAMANIYTARGDLDGAMKLYQQSLEIEDDLGDLQGRAMTLGMMGKVLWESQNYKDAIASLLQGLMQLVELKIEPQIQQAMTSDMTGWREELGAEKFDAIWKEITRQKIPEWLSQSPKQEQGMSVDQFITGAIQSAREKHPEAEHYFKAAQKMSIDSNTPAELQELGKVLQRIMIGEKNVDLSALTDELREIVEKALAE